MIPPETLRTLLATHYSWGGYAADVGQRRVVNLFRHAGFVTDTWDVQPPTQPVFAWRGARPRHGRGLSWTTDWVTAWFFAARHVQRSGRGYIYAAEMPPHAVLGIFRQRHEEELVVDPRALGTIYIAERLDPDADPNDVVDDFSPIEEEAA
ncbi:MAG: hypothetical protein AB7R89_33370 [Dehalococcoidia bacterium]